MSKVTKSDSADCIVVTHTFPPLTGGIANVMESIANAQPSNHVVVITPWKNSRKGYEHTEPDTDYIKDRDATYPFRVERIRFSVKYKVLAFISMFWLNIYALLRSVQLSSTYIHYSLCYPVGMIAPLFNFIGKKYIIHAHGSELFIKRSKIALSWQRYIYRKAYKIVAVSTWTKNALIEFGAPEDRIVVIHPRLTPERFKCPSELHEFCIEENLVNKKVILTVAHIIHRKGQHLVIQSLPELVKRHPDLVYVIVGGGPDEDSLKLLAKKQGVLDYVRFPGNRDQIKFFHACDIFVMPSLYITKPRGDIESFGIVYIEANLCEKPVIGANNGGIPEAVIDGQTGLLINTGDVNDLVEKIDILLSDDKLASKLGKQGYRRAINELSQASLTKELNDKVFKM